MDRNFGDLPENVDVVIFGTDVGQGVLAAACARNGLTVLHIDRNDYYGEKSSVFMFNPLEEMINSITMAHANGVDHEQLPITCADTEELLHLPGVDVENFQFINRDFPCCTTTQPPSYASSRENDQPVDSETQQNVEGDCTSQTSAPTENIGGHDVIQNEPRWTKEALIAASRRFNIDLSPNLVYSTGKTVELLVSSDVARYVEFKTINKLYVRQSDSFENVPCSRADVFSDSRLSLIEKRLLMRLFATALDYENKVSQENIDVSRPFVEYLRQACNLPERLTYFVKHAIAMVNDQCDTAEGLSKTRNFLKSCSVYGPTPFLWPMYGCAEFPQAFCRLAAVYGAVYVLRSSPLAIVKDTASNKCVGVVLENGKRVSCRFVAMSSSYCPPGLLHKLINNDSAALVYNLVLRAALLSSKSLFQVENSPPIAPLVYARIPKASFTASLIELPDHAMSCPSGTFLHHVTAALTCVSKHVPSVADHNSGVEEFDELLRSLFTFQQLESNESTEKPLVYWRFLFAKPALVVQNPSEDLQSADLSLLDNVFVVPNSSADGSSLDFDVSIFVAQRIFREIKPDAEEFIPKMPRPPVTEDISSEDMTEEIPASTEINGDSAHTEVQASTENMDAQTDAQPSLSSSEQNAHN